MAAHALAGMAQLVGASSGTQKVVGSINSWSGRIPTLQGLIPGPGVCVCVCVGACAPVLLCMIPSPGSVPSLGVYGCKAN